MKRNLTAFRPLTLALTAGLALSAVSVSAAPPSWGRTWTQEGVRAAYRGFLPPQEGRYPRQAGSWFEVRINNFTTEREARAIIDMYNERDGRPLRNVLGSRNIGSFRIGDGSSQPIAAAWRMRDLSGEHLVLLIPRDESVRELFQDRDRDSYDWRDRDRRDNRYDRYERSERSSRSDSRSRYGQDRSNRYDHSDRSDDRLYGASDRPYALVQLDLGDGDDRYGRGELRPANRLRLGEDGGFDVDELDGSLPVQILRVEAIEER